MISDTCSAGSKRFAPAGKPTQKNVWVGRQGISTISLSCRNSLAFFCQTAIHLSVFAKKPSYAQFLGIFFIFLLLVVYRAHASLHFSHSQPFFSHLLDPKKPSL